MTRLRPTADAGWVVYDDGLVTLAPGGARLAVHNATAALLWRRLAQGASRAELIDTLVWAYGVEPGRVGADVEATLTRWRADGLLDDGDRAGGDLSGGRPAHGPPEPAAATRLPATPVADERRWTIVLGDARIALSADPDTHAFLRPWLAHLAVDEAGPAGAPAIAIAVRALEDGTRRLSVDGRERVRTDDDGLLVGGLCQAIVEAAYPGAAWLAWIHGGAVAGREAGAGALMLPGRSGSGKSTLIAHLLSRGHRLLTDDLIALAAPDGRIVPWPMPLSLKPGSWAALAAGYPTLADAPAATFRGKAERLLMPPAAAWCAEPRRAAAICFPRYAAGAAARLTPLAPLAALVRLVEDRCHLGRPMTIEGVRAFLGWLARVPAYSLDYGDLGEAAACVEAIPIS